MKISHLSDPRLRRSCRGSRCSDDKDGCRYNKDDCRYDRDGCRYNKDGCRYDKDDCRYNKDGCPNDRGDFCDNEENKVKIVAILCASLHNLNF